MVQEKIFNDIVLICQSVFNDSNVNLSLTSKADDIHQWDSLTHIQLILAIEQKFQIKFSLGELQNLKKIGDLVRLVEKNLK